MPKTTHKLLSSPTLSPVLDEYIDAARPWLTAEAMSNHTGLHPWKIRNIVGTTQKPERKLTTSQVQRILLAFENMDEPSVEAISTMLNLPPIPVRETLMEFRHICPDLFAPIRDSGGRMTAIPEVLKLHIKTLYKDQELSSRQVVQQLEQVFGLKLTDFGVRKMLQGMGVTLRDRQRSTMLAVNKLTKVHERWLVTSYQASEMLTVPLMVSAFANKFQLEVSSGTVVRVLESYNVEIRGAKKTRTRRSEKHQERLRRTA